MQGKTFDKILQLCILKMQSFFSTVPLSVSACNPYFTW